jgi:hypothetical protein
MRIHGVVLNQLNASTTLLLSLVVPVPEASTAAILLLLVVGNTNLNRLCDL